MAPRPWAWVLPCVYATLVACGPHLAQAQQCDSSTPCSDGTCCSKWGWCGTTLDYCAPENCVSGPCGSSPPSGDKVLVGYIGARGGTVPALDSVPKGNAQVYLALSFATEGGDGNFQFTSPTFNPSGDANLDPAKAAAAAGEGYKFLIALYGDSYQYSAPSDSPAFANNAVASIQSLASQWSATGIELNVENNIDDSFAPLWCNIAGMLKASNPGFLVTASPFSATWPAYQSMWSQCSSSIDWFDYQLYAEMSPSDDPGKAASIMSGIAGVVGWDHVTVGFASDLQSPRGLQRDQFVAALGQMGQEKGVNIWAIEDSYTQQQFQDVTAIQAAL